MSLIKTEKGRSALMRRDLGLTHRERQILLICNGKRSREEMRGLFTADITQDFKRLFAMNLLIDISKEALTPENMSATGTFRVSAIGDFPVRRDYHDSSMFGELSSSFSLEGVHAKPFSTAGNSHQVATASLKPRRSMAAAKMYTLDMLQRMRDMDSPMFAVAIQTSADEVELASNVLDSLSYIYQKSGGSFGVRVFEKVYEIIPEHYLSYMDQLFSQLCMMRQTQELRAA